MRTNEELLAMYEHALADCGSLVGRAPETDLRVGTPCAGWDLAALLAHMIGQNEGFAAAVRAGDADRSAYDPRPVTASTVLPEWSASAGRVLDAFRTASDDQQVSVAGFGTFRVNTALRMHLLDTVVHAWDVAVSLEEEYRPSADLVDFAATFADRIAKASPDGQPGVFAAPLAVTGLDAWVDALRLLGRAPATSRPI
jgi:uncharacterized protein (TIGR03086 family)